MGAIEILPNEIIHQILTDVVLDSNEWKSLRLVHRLWSAHATSLLFHRVRLSKLKADRDAFFNIAKTPRLAVLVSAIVWEELAEDEFSFKHFGNPRHGNPDRVHPSLEDPDFQGLLEHLIEQSKDLFWIQIPNIVEPGQTSESLISQDDIIEEFQASLHTALDAMPNLHTFISQPMQPLRELTRSRDGYPITAQLFQRGMAIETMDNYGFTNFLGPAMLHRLSSGKDPIRRLHFGDEGSGTSFGRIAESTSVAFEALTHIDLCLSSLIKGTGVFNLFRFLEAAKNVQELSLCGERGTWTTDHNRSTRHVLDLLMESKYLQLSALRLLRLEHLPFKWPTLVRFVSRHAGTLRELDVSWSVRYEFISELAEIDNLHLNRLSVTSPKENLTYLLISENTALDVLKHKGQRDILEKEIGDRNPYLYTYPSWNGKVEEPWEVKKVVSCWNHGEEIPGLPVLPAGPYFIPWNAEIRDGSDEDNYEFDDDDMRPLDEEYAAEDDAQNRRMREAPRWLWNRPINAEDPSKPGDVYYWMVPVEEFGTHENEQTTQLWRFTRHYNNDTEQSEVAWGDDPLQFWEDWEANNESEDLAEPMPYGWRLRYFVMNGVVEGQWNIPGLQIPWDKAIKYDSESDPLDDPQQSWM